MSSLLSDSCSLSFRLRFSHDLTMQLVDLLAQLRERPGASCREHELATGFGRRRRFRTTGGAQPPVGAHAREQRIERARAHVKAVPPKFLEKPLAVDRALLRMMQD